MEFRQLTYFLAAAHTQNFRKAAELCLVMQPALSRQIAALEKELGIELFRHVKQHVELTPAGQTFVGYAQDALEVLQQGEQELARWQQGQEGTVPHWLQSSLAAAFLPLLPHHNRFYDYIDIYFVTYENDSGFVLVKRHTKVTAVDDSVCA